MKQAALVSYLRKTLGTAVRASGFLALTQQNCKACSAYPDNIEPAQKDVGDVIDRLDQLIEVVAKKGGVVCD
jgi:hypothetical protein